ncbi:MAG: hypothetical protein QW445_07565 [Candidatus Bathyarchaeia archaeon]
MDYWIIGYFLLFGSFGILFAGYFLFGPLFAGSGLLFAGYFAGLFGLLFAGLFGLLCWFIWFIGYWLMVADR